MTRAAIHHPYPIHPIHHRNHAPLGIGEERQR